MLLFHLMLCDAQVMLGIFTATLLSGWPTAPLADVTPFWMSTGFIIYGFFSVWVWNKCACSKQRQWHYIASLQTRWLCKSFVTLPTLNVALINRVKKLRVDWTNSEPRIWNRKLWVCWPWLTATIKSNEQWSCGTVIHHGNARSAPEILLLGAGW